MQQVEFTSEEQKRSLIENLIASGNVVKEYRIIENKKFVIYFTREEWLDISIRPERDRLLQKTDFMMLTDNVEKITKEEYEELKDYRQALRDLPKTIPVLNYEKSWPACPVKIKEKLKL